MKLNEFKKFEVTEKEQVLNIKGGIKCSQVGAVLDYLYENNIEQFEAVLETFSNNTLQCD